MTANMFTVAAEQEAAYTETQLWIIAAVAWIALSVAIATTPLRTPRTGRPLGTGARIAVGFGTALVGSILAYLRAGTRGTEGTDALKLVTVAVLTIVVMRILFAKWIRRADEQYWSGKPVKLSFRGGVFFAVTIVVLMISIGVVLSQLPVWLPMLWA